ncbi:hypothetical protein MASR1M31_20140 [Porphyromonadaceae bacterium]
MIMNDRIKKILSNVWYVSSKLNKYVITLVVFLVMIVFFDEYNVIRRYKNIATLSKLEKELQYYEKQIEGRKKQLDELDTDAASLEKFAREQYRMKRKDEDIFIVK